MARSMTLASASGQTSTFAALRIHNFRLYFIGQMISMSGTWMQSVAQSYLVFQLTKSEFMLGIVVCAAGLPTLFISPFAGVLVERMPRRQLMLITQASQMILAFILALLVVTNTVLIWHIILLALLLGVTNSFDAPARQAFVVDLVGKEHLTSGIALNSIIVNGARVFGPSIAGIVLVVFGAGWCFFLNGVSFLVVIVTLLLLNLPGFNRPETSPAALMQIREGLRYVRRQPVVLPLLMLTAIGGFFGWATNSLFASFADEVLLSPEQGFAIITAANGAGAVIAGLTVGILGQRYGRGPLLATVALLIGLSTMALALTNSVLAATVMSLLLGFCIITYFITINTSIQLAIPNELRGRVLSLYTLCIMGLNPIGALVLGRIADEIGNSGGIFAFGLIFAVLTGWIVFKFPQLRAIE